MLPRPLLGANRELAVVFQVELRQSTQFMERFTASWLREYFALVDEVIAQGQREGSLRADLNRKVATKALFGALDEMVTSWIVGGKDYDLARLAAHALFSPNSILPVTPYYPGLETVAAALAQAGAALLAATNHVGRPNNGLVGVWPKANQQGAYELGFAPDADLENTLSQTGALYIAAADPAVRLSAGPFQTAPIFFQCVGRSMPRLGLAGQFVGQQTRPILFQVSQNDLDQGVVRVVFLFGLLSQFATQSGQSRLDCVLLSARRLTHSMQVLDVFGRHPQCGAQPGEHCARPLVGIGDGHNLWIIAVTVQFLLETEQYRTRLSSYSRTGQ